MKLRVSPKKCARITGINRPKIRTGRKTTTTEVSYVKHSNESLNFNFEVITPLMQDQERNSAYSYFSL